MKSKLKNLLVTAILCLACSVAFGQTNLNKTFIGYWTSDGTTTRQLFFLDKENTIQLISYDTNKDYPFEEKEILKIQVVNNAIKTTEKMVSTNWVTYNTYTVIDENTLKCSIGGDGNGGIIFFKRLK